MQAARGMYRSSRRTLFGSTLYCCWERLCSSLLRLRLLLQLLHVFKKRFRVFCLLHVWC
jgi:hypothetical protein